MLHVRRQAFAWLAVFVLTSRPYDVSGAWEDDVLARLETLERTSTSLIRQTILQQFSQEESRRSDGDSGLKQVRSSTDGTRAYYSATHTSFSTAAIHDHADNIRTCGMGETEVVLNGVHFRTRHNDYGLYEPSRTSGDLHAVDEVPLPDVPPAVASAGSVVNQIREMRMWFRAWRDQDTSARDYRPYFRPVLCYLEGAWTNNEDLDEPFESTRHHLDALSWLDLQEKARFTAYTGDKDQLENYAYLPTAIFNITEGVPVLGQWNYRILCHRIQGDLDPTQIKPIDDLSSRLRWHKGFEDYTKTRAARFSLSDQEEPRSAYAGDTILDRLMAEIPGKDNYIGNLQDDSLGRLKYDVHDDGKVLNTAYYHRWYKTGEKDAMGVSINHRGFADRNMFVAQTSQPGIVPMGLDVCNHKGDNCTNYTRRVSYAIPLEIVWLTPLMSWNPYGLEYKGMAWTDEGQTVTAGGRNGGMTPETALNGTNNVNYAITPVEFFSGGEVNPNPADTVRGAIGVLDPRGHVQRVTSSGVRIFLPEIVDVPGGNIRTRFPVCPVFAEGSTAFKEVEALKELVMDLEGNQHYLHKTPSFGAGGAAPQPPESPWYTLVTSASDATTGVHVHTVELQNSQALSLINDGEFVVVRTTLANAHAHTLNVTFDQAAQQFYYIRCDDGPEDQLCWDGHPQPLFREV